MFCDEEREMRSAFDRELRHMLVPVARGLALLYGGLAVGNLLWSAHPFSMFGFSTANAFVFALAARWLRRGTFPPERASLVALGFTGIVYLYSAVALFLTREVVHRSDFVIVILGASLILFSRVHLWMLVGAVALTWGAGVFWANPALGSPHYGFVLAVASGMGIAIQRLRMEAFRRLIQRQRESDRQRDEIRHILSGVRGLLWYATVTRSDGAFEWDLHVSDPEAAQRFLPLDLQPGQTYEQAWYESKLPEYRGHIDEVALGALLRGRSSYSHEYPCRRRDGEIRWLYEDVRIAPLGEGKWHLVGVCTDVTELKHAERARRESEEQFRILFENAPIGMTILSLEGKIVRANRELARILGCPPRELLSESFRSYLYPEDAPREEELWSRLLSGEIDSFRVEERAVTKKGAVVWGNVTVFPLFSSRGELLFLVRIFEDITERKAAEELERNTARRIEAILRSAADGIMTVNAEGVIGQFNPAAERLFGYTAEEALAKTFFDLVVSGEMRTPQALREFVARGGAEGGVVHADAVGIRKDRSTFIVNLALSELLLGEERFFTVVVRDVTERRHAELALAASEERFRAVFEAAAVGIFVVSPEGKILRANNALAEFLGYSREELERMSFRDIAHPEDADRDRELFEDLLVGKRARYAVENRYRHRNGSTLWGFLTASAVRDPNGKVLYVVCMIEDITERRQALDALRESEERYRDLFENATDLIQSVRPDGTFAYVNRAWLQALGYSREEVAHLHLMDVIHPECREMCAEIFRRVMAGESVDVVQADFITRRGERIAVEGSVSCRYENGAPVATRAILRDVTERKQLERLKDEFISTVSHELRTPLTSIFGALGLLLGGAAGPFPETVRRMLQIAYSNSERLIRLVNDILDMQKMESGRMEFHLEPLEIGSLVRESVEANRAYAEQFHVSYQVEDRSEGAKARVDRDRLLQVMANLLSNAAKFTAPGTTVEVRLDADEHFVRVSVKDYGPGIPPEFRSRIFTKFAQADASDSRQKGGTGLGLSITKAILERLGGEITYESVLGEGTTFTFTLPRSPDELEPPHRGEGKQLLICEDDPDTAAVMCELLSRAGYTVEVAPTASRAKELLAAKVYDALLLDVILPDASGISLLRALREQEPTQILPVVVVSVIAEEERERLNGSALEVVDWINKPFDAERLLRAVDFALRGSLKGRPHILHVEDDMDVLHVVASVLNVADVTFATTLREAREKLAEVTYDLVLLDVVLPDGSGLDLLPLLTESEPPTPVVIFSACEVSPEMAGKVQAVLVKSKTSNAHLLSLVESLLAKRRARESSRQT